MPGLPNIQRHQTRKGESDVGRRAKSIKSKLREACARHCYSVLLSFSRITGCSPSSRKNRYFGEQVVTEVAGVCRAVS